MLTVEFKRLNINHVKILHMAVDVQAMMIAAEELRLMEAKELVAYSASQEIEEIQAWKTVTYCGRFQQRIVRMSGDVRRC